MVQRSSIEYNSVEHSSIECSSYEVRNIYSNLSATPLNAVPLSDQQQLRSNHNYFVAEIKEQESMIKSLSKYISSFDYFDRY